VIKFFRIFEKLVLTFRKYNFAIQVVKPLLFLYLLWQWTACCWFYVNLHYEYDKDLAWGN